ncbi:MAG: DOMON domain-containing protein [Dehalococcoidia bacterium]|jgi:hypothetical protein
MSKIYALRTVIPALILLLAFSAAGCQAPSQPEPKATLPPSLPAPAVGTQPEGQSAVAENVTWAADGMFKPGEYSRSKSFGDFELSWSTDDLYLYMGMKARTAGWVAVGFDPSSQMKDADIVQGFIKDGVLSIADQYSTGQFGPHPADTQQGGTEDILAAAGGSDGGFTTIEFKRRLDTGDKFDKPLGKGTHKIIWAYGSDPQFTLKHMARGSGEIDL